uniref:hypothetical protein n=1 Tax=Daedaleopsis nitida TaxID=1140402 RepID=UPI0030E033C0
MEFNFNKDIYEIDLRKEYTFRLIHIILLYIFPLIFFINLFSYLPKFCLFETIFCEPGDSVTNTNNQINTNIQETSLSTNSKNINGQGNKNTQLANNISESNTNIQSNENQQMNTPYRVSNEDIKYYVIDKIKNKYKLDSFWHNIIYLENLRGKGILSNEYITDRINLIIGEATDKSNFNRLIFTNKNNKYLQELLFPNRLYARFRQLPVLFNNSYEIYDVYMNMNKNKLYFTKIYSSANSLFNIIDFYSEFKERKTSNEIINKSILKNIGIMIHNSCRGLVDPNNI